MKKVFSRITQSTSAIWLNGRRLLKLAWEADRKITLLYFLTAVIGGLTPLAGSIVLKYLIDQLQIGQEQVWTTIPVIVIIVLGARYLVNLIEGIGFWGYHSTYLDHLFRSRMQNAITIKFHRKVTKLDIAHFENPETQNLITRTRETMPWRLPDFLRFMSEMSREMIGYIAAVIILIPFGWWIPIIVTLITIPRLYLRARYGAINWSILATNSPQTRRVWYLNYLLQDDTTVREMKISQSAPSLVNKLKGLLDYLYRENKKPLDRYLKVLTIPPIIEVIVIVLIAYVFLPDVLSGAITIGSYTLLVNMLDQLNSRAADASVKFGRMYENNLYVDNYFQLMDLKQLIKESDHPHIFTEIKPPHIEFKNVSFRYAKGPEVIKDISFTIEPGQSMALVGENGAGKSTIVKLLCRFYDVTGGEILINGKNLKELELKNWYKFLGTLFQEFVRYHFTVKENITMGAPKKNDDKLMKEAAQKSGAVDFIEKFPKKYNQLLGREFDDGQELSGGEWQKLAIARAFYEEPPVLILDEPTSAIDAEAEFGIFNNLEKQYRQKTLVLVSHRFSTVRNAEKILVIDDGKISERGSHEDLLKNKGKYARMFGTQAAGYR